MTPLTWRHEIKSKRHAQNSRTLQHVFQKFYYSETTEKEVYKMSQKIFFSFNHKSISKLGLKP